MPTHIIPTHALSNYAHPFFAAGRVPTQKGPSCAYAGYKNTLESKKICSYNRYVLITGIYNTVDLRTVIQMMVLISVTNCKFYKWSSFELL